MELLSELTYSEIDSKRFGLKIHRMRTEKIDAPYVLAQVLEQEIDVAILRVPATQLAQLDKLERTAMPFIVADTLAEFKLDLTKAEPRELAHPEIDYVLATPQHHAEINHIVLETMNEYVNHYRANPFFDNRNVNDGYQDWVKSYAESSDKRICWLLREKGETIGFAAFNFEEEGVAKGILYGVRKKDRRRNIFRDIMRHGINYAIDRGCHEMQATSQIENIVLQRVWSSEGFTLVNSLNTIHVNSLLNKSVFDAFDVPLIIGSEEINTSKISNRHILKQINWHFDFKQNVVTQNHRFVNIKPLEIGVEYTLHFSFPTGSKALLRVTDRDRKTYILVYFDLMHVIA